MDENQEVEPAFNSEAEQAEQEPHQEDSITWQASEFIVHEKTPSWYVGYVLVSLTLLVMLYFLTNKEIIPLLIVAAALVFIFVYALRKPRTLTYSIDERGLTVDQKTYDFNEFRSFALIQEGGIMSISLHPLQRFSLPLSVYFDPDRTDDIVEILSFYLPNEAGRLSFIDIWSRKLRL